MKKSNVLGAFALAAALAVSGAALAQMPAQTPGWYLGGSTGQTQAKDTCGSLPINSLCEDDDKGVRIFAGYQVNRNMAIEAGYVDLGDFHVGAPGLSRQVETTAWDLVGIASLPITGQFSLYGKLGVFRAKSELTGPRIDKENSTDLTFGLGAQYHFTPNFAARLEWQRYKDVGGNVVGKDDIDFFSLGLLYKL